MESKGVIVEVIETRKWYLSVEYDDDVRDEEEAVEMIKNMYDDGELNQDEASVEVDINALEDSDDLIDDFVGFSVEKEENMSYSDDEYDDEEDLNDEELNDDDYDDVEDFDDFDEELNIEETID